MGKVKIILAVVFAFVVGTIVTGTGVDAASNAQGQPFQQLQQQISDLGLTLGTILCADSEVLKWDDASSQWACANDNVGEVEDGSITTAKLADDATTSEKIVDGTITSADIADDTVTSAKIVDGTITSADIADGTITSADLVPGAVELNVQAVESELVVANTQRVFSAIAECPDGTTLVGGGHRSAGISATVEGIIIESKPLSDTEWRVQFSYDRMGSGQYGFHAIAMCASITP